MEANYRILTSDYRVKYVGTNIGSWFTLGKAKELVNYENGEMIYQYTKLGERLCEVL